MVEISAMLLESILKFYIEEMWNLSKSKVNTYLKCEASGMAMRATKSDERLPPAYQCFGEKLFPFLKVSTETVRSNARLGRHEKVGKPSGLKENASIECTIIRKTYFLPTCGGRYSFL